MDDARDDSAGWGRPPGALLGLLLGAGVLVIGLLAGTALGDPHFHLPVSAELSPELHEQFEESYHSEHSRQLALGGAALILLALAGAGMLVFQRTTRSHIERLEQARRQAARGEARYRSLVDNIDLGVTLIDNDYRVVMSNVAQGRLLNREPGSFVGESCFHAFEQRESPCSHCPGTRAMASGQPQSVVTTGRNPAGEPIEVQLRAFPVLDGAGSPQGFIEIVEDITWKKDQEARLQMARFSVDHAAESIFWVRIDGTFADVNEQACRSLGLGREALLERSLFDIAPETLASDWQTRWEQLRSSGSLTFESLHRRADGTTFPVELMMSHLESEGQELACIFARDLSGRLEAEEERLHLERQVQHAQKLESLGVMAGGIAHDFNNLLMGVLGNAELLRMRLPKEEVFLGHLDGIETSATRAAELSRQMLAFSGKSLVKVDRLDLNQLIEEMIHLFEAAISRKAVLQLELAPDLPEVEADSTQIRQVILNLITNASEAVEDGMGVIRVKTSRIHADEALLANTYLDEKLEPGCYSVIEVSDTGCGMDLETRERIFDPFFTTKFTGRGLGLAAVLGIVRAHRGAIQIESERGQGTTIRALLPCLEAAEQAAEAPPSQLDLDAWRGQGTILVVDDEPTIRSISRIGLEMKGFEVLLAEDGHRAIDVYEANADAIVLVVLDMTMPRMDGPETHRQFLARGLKVPVILASGYSEAEATERFSAAGLAGFLPKPFAPAELVAQVRKALEG
ncbi:MAG: PAS domain S-box protein [Deltaproteobacteria bacterium]|nr:PAS domain S-box protein [Deltaproteobacteria bacterium]